MCAYSLDHITPSCLGAIFLPVGTKHRREIQRLNLLGTRGPRLSLTTRLSSCLRRSLLPYFSKNHRQATVPGDIQILCVRSDRYIKESRWWSLSGSNRRPPACKAGALPAELRPHVVGLGGLEPPASPLSGVRSNHLSYRPSLALDYQSCRLLMRTPGQAMWPCL